MPLPDEDRIQTHNEATLRTFAELLGQRGDAFGNAAAADLKRRADRMLFAGARLEDLNEELT